MYYVPAICVCLLMPGLSFAQTTLKIPEEVKPSNGYVVLLPEGNAKTVTYISESNVHPFPSALLKDSRQFVLPTSGLQKGSYNFIAVGSLNDEHVVVRFTVKVDDGSNPQPPPNPPGPVASDVWLIVVEETQQRNPEIAQVLGDLTFWRGLPIGGYRFYDRSSIEVNARQYIAMANERVPGNSPVLLIVDSNGKFVAGMPLPKDKQVIRQAVKQITGK